MALALLFSGSAEGHALVQNHVVADDGCLTDHHAVAVIDEKVLADLSPRMDLDLRLAGRLLRQLSCLVELAFFV